MADTIHKSEGAAALPLEGRVDGTDRNRSLVQNQSDASDQSLLPLPILAAGTYLGSSKSNIPAHVDTQLTESKEVFDSATMASLNQCALDVSDYLVGRVTRDLKANALVYKATPSMSAENANRIKQLVQKEPWTLGRVVVVNRNSNTISLFDFHDKHFYFFPRAPVPLYYQGVPVIPHHFSDAASPLVRPQELSILSMETDLDGLTSQQIRLLSEYFGYIEAIDFYLDRWVVVTIPRDLYTSALEKVESPYFQAWNCIFRLVPSPTNQPKSKINSGKKPVSVPAPGFRVQSDIGVKSTLGALLSRRNQKHSASSPTIGFFTVSRHSFTAKRAIDLKPGLLSTAVLAAVLHMAYTLAEEAILPWQLYQQLVLIKVGIIAQDYLWIFGGRRLGFHILVSPIGSNEAYSVVRATAYQKVLLNADYRHRIFGAFRYQSIDALSPDNHNTSSFHHGRRP